MLKKVPAATVITIFSFVISITGIINDVFYGTVSRSVILIKQLADPLNLGWAFSRHYAMRDNGLNSINAIFHIVLLLGTLLYILSKQKETRLIRFVYSIILLSNTLPFINSVIFFLFVRLGRPMTFHYFMIDILFYIVQLCWIYIAWKVLKYFNSLKELQCDSYEQNGETIVYYIEASLWQRILHPLADAIVAFMLFSPIIQTFIFAAGNQSFSSMPSLVPPGIVLSLMIVVIRSIYYLLYEIILGATPAKLLTETRVINYEGTKPAFKNIAGRTFARLIPLESFTFFQHSGLHDKLSHTMVVKEKRTGVHGSYYFWIIPATIFIIVAYNVGATQYYFYKQKNSITTYRNRLGKELEQNLTNADTTDFFELRPINEGYTTNSQTDKFLKVEKVLPGAITFSVLSTAIKSYREPRRADAERAYLDHKGMLVKVTLSKKALLAALKSVAEPDYEQEAGIIPIKVAGALYTIKSIHHYFMPDIELGSSYGYGTNYFSLELVDKGWKADITDIKILEGNIKITTPLPVHLNPRFEKHIEGSANGDAVNFKLNITVLDSLNRQQVYQITGNTEAKSDRTITRIK